MFLFKTNVYTYNKSTITCIDVTEHLSYSFQHVKINVLDTSYNLLTDFSEKYSFCT